MHKWITSQQLRDAKGTLDPNILKVFASTLEKADGLGERVVRFTITTDDVDRENDVITPAGWETDNFLAAKGPILWAHDYRQPPVGKTLHLARTDHGLSADVEFADAKTYAFADTVYQLIKGEFLNATSVGFRTLEWTWDEVRGGMTFLRQELLEASVVPVPANPHCLVEARGAGIDVEPLREWATKTIEYLTATPAASVPAVKADATTADIREFKRAVDEACGSVERFTIMLGGLEQALEPTKVKILPKAEVVETPVVEPEKETPVSALEPGGTALEAPATGSESPAQGEGAGTDIILELDEEEDDLSIEDVRSAVREALTDITKESVTAALNQRRGRVD